MAPIAPPPPPLIGYSLTTDEFWWVGVLLEVFATFLSTLGKELFRLAALAAQSLERKSSTAPLAAGSVPAAQRIASLPLWCIYLTGASCALIFSPLLEAVAYAYTAQSILSACAGLVLVWNVLLAQGLLNEQCTLSRAASAAVIVLGTFGVGITGNHVVQRQLSSAAWGHVLTRGMAVAYYLVLSAMLLAICYLTSKQHRPSTKNTLKAMLGGAISGGTQFLTKASISLLQCAFFTQDCPDDPFEHATIYVVTPLTLLFHGIAIYVLADALRKSEALVAIAMYEGMVIIAGTFSGILVLGEASAEFTPVRALFYVISLLLIVLGLVLLTRWPAALGDGDALAADVFKLQKARLVAAYPSLRWGKEGAPTEVSQLVGGKRSDLVGGGKSPKGKKSPAAAPSSPAAGSSC